MPFVGANGFGLSAAARRSRRSRMVGATVWAAALALGLGAGLDEAGLRHLFAD